MNTILALDGATLTSGLALLGQEDGKAISLLDANKISLSKTLSMPERLVAFRREYCVFIDLNEPTFIAIEDLKFNRGAPNFSSLTKVAMIIGVAIEAAASRGYEPILLTATTVRARIGNKTKKNRKAETRAIVNKHFEAELKKLGWPTGLKTKDSDISDAVALGWVSFSEELVKSSLFTSNDSD